MATALPEDSPDDQPERRRLADATRALVAAVLETPDVGDDVLRDSTDRVEQVVAGLVTGGTSRVNRVREHDQYLPRSPLVGRLNAVSPPLAYESTTERVVARGVFGSAYEGPPGYVHGGWIALAFDEVLGMTNIASGHPGMTGRLAIRYRRPTPLHTELVIEARTAAVDGRRITTVGTMQAGDVVTAEAEGLFVTLGEERSLEYFGERPRTEEPTDPLP